LDILNLAKRDTVLVTFAH